MKGEEGKPGKDGSKDRERPLRDPFLAIDGSPILGLRGISYSSGTDKDIGKETLFPSSF